MQLSHTLAATSAVFDEPNLVSSAGLAPVMALAESAGLHDLADTHLSVPTDKGANAGSKVASLVGGMVAGADSIDDMALLRHGGMGRVFTGIYAPSTLGSFLRSFTFGHVRQLDAIASRFLTRLAGQAPLLEADRTENEEAMVDVDDTIIEVHGYAKQGAGFGYSGVRGLNALLATLTRPGSAPVIVAQRLRKGSTGSPRGAKRLVTDALKTVRALSSDTPLVRADSAFYGRPTIGAAVTAGAHVSVTVRLDTTVKKAIASIDESAWQTIEYTDAVYDETTDQWISRAEVAEIGFTAFSGRKKADQVPGRLVVRRIPDLHATPAQALGQDALFDTWRFHAFFTTVPDQAMNTVTVDKTHRNHAIIEQVHADLKNSALAHLPSGRFAANAAWLVLAVMAFNLTRAAATLTGPTPARATTATIRRKLIAVPARLATSARQMTLHLPAAWPWQTAWTRLFTHTCGPPTPATT
ncbi:IS1380 family transposase [Actinopolymorpha alba]|uniref:IS1380 family transposase n=1 Tax=Actinopolymorpha alba TaxID=533267 RepID=UPI0003719323|nr:IS1380 family transposase [Actinopolymorpha alba]